MTHPLPYLIAYSMPMVAGGMMNIVTVNYLMKYATDVLYIAPAAMGTIFFISRIWDAINDPIIGYLSDHSNSSQGRRKVWIGYATPVLLVSFYLFWFIPKDGTPLLKQGLLLALLIVFFTSMTALYVPHYALGAELDSARHQRNRIYGLRALWENLGTFLGVFFILRITQSADQILGARLYMAGLLAIALLSILWLLLRIHERPAPPESITATPWHSLRMMAHNRPALIVFATGFFSQFGAAVLLALMLYFAQYVMLSPDAGPILTAVFLLSATATIPLWIVIARHVSKKKIWFWVQIGLATGFAVLFLTPSESSEAIYALAALLGALAGAVLFIHPSLLADTATLEQKRFGTSQQGAYFALFTFINKSAMGLANGLVGFLLAYVHFVPNVEQGDIVKAWIKGGYSLVPAVSFVIGALILSLFPQKSVAQELASEEKT